MTDERMALGMACGGEATPYPKRIVKGVHRMYKNISCSIKGIYDRLQDDESRAIFRHRLSYMLDGDISHIWDMLRDVGEYDGIKQWPANRPRNLLDIRKQYVGQPLVLYGAGGNAPYIGMFLEYLGIKPIAYCDGDPRKWGGLKDGLPVIPPHTLREMYPDALIVVSSPIYEDDIVDNLIRMNVCRESIFLSTFSEKQYFGVPFITYDAHGTYIDAGSFDGLTVVQFAEFSQGRYKKIYAMEPDAANYAMTRACVAQNGLRDVHVIEKGAWSCNGTLYFASGASGSRLTESGSIQVPVATIDDIAGEDDITLIKMDIEGAELAALEGCRETIKRCRPQLAVCVYHKPEDILEIPLFLLTVHGGYRFYIRQHVTSMYETVLYAVE